MSELSSSNTFPVGCRRNEDPNESGQDTPLDLEPFLISKSAKSMQGPCIALQGLAQLQGIGDPCTPLYLMGHSMQGSQSHWRDVIETV